MLWAQHVARRGLMRNVYKILVRNLTGKGRLEYIDVDVSIT